MTLLRMSKHFKNCYNIIVDGNDINDDDDDYDNDDTEEDDYDH